MRDVLTIELAKVGRQGKVGSSKQNINMELSNNRIQQSKNKRKLIQQNTRLQEQIQRIREHVAGWAPEESGQGQRQREEEIRPILDEIHSQEKLIQRLRGQIQMFKLERAKDNVEYIVREEDHLKIMRKQELRLIDEKQILEGRKVDKSCYLQRDAPYEKYEKGFLAQLTEVSRFNREQGAKITETERDIRKYHLIRKGKDVKIERLLSSELVTQLEDRINEKVEGRKTLESQWGPHFEQLDDQFARLLHQASKKREETGQLQRQEKTWQTRVSAIRQFDLVMTDKTRRGSIKPSAKLKQKLIDLIDKTDNRKIVSEEELKYQFVDSTAQKKTPVEEGKVASGPPILPGQKQKKQDRVMETLHNDKNITKKIERGNAKKAGKNNQTSNTDVTISPGKKRGKLSKEASKKIAEVEEYTEESPKRVWQASNQPERQNFPKSEEGNSVSKVEDPSKTGIIQLREVGLSTSVQNWQEG